MAEGSKFAQSLRNYWQWIGTILILSVLAVILMPVAITDRPRLHESSMLQIVHVVSLLMFSYANDHDGKYPIGKSSTEVFQKLIDEQYVNDPTIFYFEMQGKSKPTSNKLKPENVSYDITVPVDNSDSDDLPIVFLTGYKIQYIPNGRAMPLKASAAKFYGLAVAYKNNTARFVLDDHLSDHVVTNFISPNFNPAGKKYQQLTPEGVLGQ